jgi:predicted small lipoprotein YifL
MKRAIKLSALLLSLLALTSCAINTPDARPDDSRIRDTIKLLIEDMQANHPDLVNWKAQAVTAEINRKLPVGKATEAGWTLTWPSYSPGELAQVVLPWSLIGQFPNHFALDTNNYSGGSIVKQSVATQIESAQLKGDTYFAAIVHIRQSQKDPHWIIFTSVPYLPITDIAYGWAHLENNKWSIADFGTALVGCGLVPATVQAEFGMSCP